MGKRLVIAEKPMLAKAILDAIPGTANPKSPEHPDSCACFAL